MNIISLILGGLVVTVLTTDPRSTGSNLAKHDGFLRVIKILSTTSIRGEVKLVSHVVRFYGMLKIPTV
jgi:hypothetical protein